MKIYKEINQRSLEWFDLKWSKVSGTSADYFLKLNTSKGFQLDKKAQDINFSKLDLFDEIMAQKNESITVEESYVNEAMQRGIDLEPVAMSELINQTGIDFQEVGFIERTLTHGHSPDGISKCETIGVEIKCPTSKVHNKTIRANETPLNHLAQCVNMFACVDTLKSLYFVSFRPESTLCPLFINVLTRETEISIDKKTYTIGQLAAILIDRIDEMELKIEEETKVIKERNQLKTAF